MLRRYRIQFTELESFLDSRSLHNVRYLYWIVDNKGDEGEEVAVTFFGKKKHLFKNK